MKQIFIPCLSLLAAATVAAQEPQRPAPTRDSIRIEGFVAADDPALPQMWRFDPATLRMVRVEPSAPDAPVPALRIGAPPSRVVVLGDNTLRLGRRVNFSNGQAWNWGPYPDALLDARTLSFPGR